MELSRKVQQFVLTQQGRDWAITSIYAYRFKDTGEWSWVIHLVRKNWMETPGEREATLLVTQENEKFCARPVEMHRFNRNHLS